MALSMHELPSRNSFGHQSGVVSTSFFQTQPIVGRALCGYQCSFDMPKYFSCIVCYILSPSQQQGGLSYCFSRRSRKSSGQSSLDYTSFFGNYHRLLLQSLFIFSFGSEFYRKLRRGFLQLMYFFGKTLRLLLERMPYTGDPFVEFMDQRGRSSLYQWPRILITIVIKRRCNQLSYPKRRPSFRL